MTKQGPELLGDAVRRFEDAQLDSSDPARNTPERLAEIRQLHQNAAEDPVAFGGEVAGHLERSDEKGSDSGAHLTAQQQQQERIMKNFYEYKPPQPMV